MANENTQIKEPIKEISRTHKIRIYPNKDQKKYINSCFGIYRLVYNNSVDFIKNNKSINFINVRNNILNTIENKYPNNDWFNELYFDYKTYNVAL